MELLTGAFVFTLGLVVGSFLTCLTYRIPKDLDFIKGRSFCPKCKHRLEWIDNIPLFSWLLLQGRCRYCKSKISLRYPIIELALGVIFLSAYLMYLNCSGVNYYFCSLSKPFTLPFLLFNISLILSIFIVDLESTIIPDELVFLGMIVVILTFFVGNVGLYTPLAVSFSLAAFYLSLNLATKGKGMGLGDAKFALYGGLLLTPRAGVLWLFLSFMIGSIVGVLLIILGKAKFGAKIPFGPFMAVALLATLVITNLLTFPI